MAYALEEHNMLQHSGTLTIGLEQSRSFSRLSGDRNPLHVDPIAARRLHFGSTVVHGVHHMLQILDAAFCQMPELSDNGLAKLRANFPHPVRIDDKINYNVSALVNTGEVHLEAMVAGKRVLKLSLEFSAETRKEAVVEVLRSEPPPEKPIRQAFPPDHDRGYCKLYLDDDLRSTLFPFLSQNMPAAVLSQILACTRVVGMRCPGLHSVFSGLRLQIRDVRAGAENVLRYRVKSSDARFQLLNIAVEGPDMTGTLDAFFRPPPVEQASYHTVRDLVAVDRFAGQRALVLGGSRGLGETAAKILAAGGAVVTNTYSRGEADARRVEAEIAEGGGRCSTRWCDILAASNDAIERLLDECKPQHIFYFASPKILPDTNVEWNANLFEKYCEVYLNSFSRLVHIVGRTARPSDGKVSIYYPSSTYVERPERGFREYAVAKAAGEALCRQLSHRFDRIEFFTPRLPRLATDQTASIMPLEVEPPLRVMLKVLELGDGIS